jgi:hypothetical protein
VLILQNRKSVADKSGRHVAVVVVIAEYRKGAVWRISERRE